MSGIGPHHPTRQTTDQPHQPSTAAACRWSRSWVEIDLGALRRNYRLCRELACRGGAGDCLIPAIKKDGYGHGLLNVARALTQEPGLWGFAIATVEEAVLLRGPESGVGRERRLLMLAPLHGEALEEAIRLDVDLTVTDATEAAEVARAARRLGARATVHFKLDTGMGRIGRLPAEAAGEFARVLAMPELRVAAVYSHMADAWNSVESRDSQRRAMEAFRSAAPGVAGLPVHWGGSDALAFAEALAPGDGLRVGIAVYATTRRPAFEPVMTFRTRVISGGGCPPGRQFLRRDVHDVADERAGHHRRGLRQRAAARAGQPGAGADRRASLPDPRAGVHGPGGGRCDRSRGGGRRGARGRRGGALRPADGGRGG